MSTGPTTPTAYRRAPGPQGHWLFGSHREILRKGWLQFCVDAWRASGDIIRFRLGPLIAHLIAHPDAVAHVLLKNRQNYEKGLTYTRLRAMVGLGLLTSEGELWQRQRRLLQPPFTARAVTRFDHVMTSIAETLLARWQAASAQGQPVDVHRGILELTLRVIGCSMLSVDLGEEGGSVVAAYHQACKLLDQRFAAMIDLPLAIPTPANLRLRRALRTLDDFIYRLIDERRAASHQAQATLEPADVAAAGPAGRAERDLLDKLLTAGEAGAGMSPQQVRDEVMTMFFAGHETTAQALTWTWYALSQHPDVEARLHHEIDTVLAGHPPTAQDLAQLTYTRRVIDETLRLFPPVWIFPRGTIDDDQLGGYDIPAGSLVFLCPYLAHRHPDFWEQPETFDPDRFMPERFDDRTRAAYVPFGAGPRACLGNHYALQEAVLVVALFAQRYRFRLLPGHRVEPQSAITLYPAGGLPMLLEPRH
jgi:cytochrome P450